MRANLSILIGLFVGSAACSAQYSPAEYYLRFQEAQDASAKGEHDRAISLWTQLARETPDNPVTWFRLAQAYRELGEVDRAIEAGARFHTLGFFRPDIFAYQLAQAHARTGAPNEAVRWLDTALTARAANRSRVAADAAFETLRGDTLFARLAGVMPASLDRTAGWQFDIDYLVDEIQRLHASPDRIAFGDAFVGAAAKLSNRVGQLSDDAITTEITRLIAMLNDGHSSLWPVRARRAEVNLSRLPIKLYFFPEGLYVVAGVGDGRALVGSEVLSIGGLSPTEALAAVEPYANRDNSMMIKWVGAGLLERLLMLETIGASPDGRSVALELRQPDGTERMMTLSGGTHQLPRKLTAPSSAQQPMWLERVGTNYWLRPIPERELLYFQFNQVLNQSDGPSIAAFADSLRLQLRSPDVSTLVIDMRHNTGGNNTLITPLLRALVGFQEADTDHRIFVITGRYTFSAAQNFINFVERLTDAVFVGEPSSSRPNFVGETAPFSLPYSGLRGSISNRYWQDGSPGDERSMIYPEVPVPVTAAAFFAGRDPALEAIFEILDRT